MGYWQTDILIQMKHLTRDQSISGVAVKASKIQTAMLPWLQSGVHVPALEVFCEEFRAAWAAATLPKESLSSEMLICIVSTPKLVSTAEEGTRFCHVCFPSIEKSAERSQKVALLPQPWPLRAQGKPAPRFNRVSLRGEVEQGQRGPGART